jgi:hypothetical protein
MQAEPINDAVVMRETVELAAAQPVVFVSKFGFVTRLVRVVVVV